MSKKTGYTRLAQTKIALANKCERLIKTCKSKPRKKTLKNQAERFRRQAEQFSRM